MRDDIQRLEDIVHSITIIEKALSKNPNLYELGELEYLGIVRCIEIIGEACNAITNELKNKYPEITWRAIINMRNVLIHQYFEVDEDKIEEVVINNLPELKKSIEKILSKEINK